jgi:hypothetical protein
MTGKKMETAGNKKEISGKQWHGGREIHYVINAYGPVINILWPVINVFLGNLRENW